MLLRVSAMPTLPFSYAVSVPMFPYRHSCDTVSYSLEVSRFGQCVLSFH